MPGTPPAFAEEIVDRCVHSRVAEMYWQDGGSLPSKVTIDEVVA